MAIKLLLSKLIQHIDRVIWTDFLSTRATTHVTANKTAIPLLFPLGIVRCHLIAEKENKR